MTLELSSDIERNLTALMKAIVYDEDWEPILDADVDINERNFYGSTALFQAIVFKKLDAVKKLIKRGADLNIPMRCGETPLHFTARQHGWEEYTRILMRAGADESIRMYPPLIIRGVVVYQREMSDLNYNPLMYAKSRKNQGYILVDRSEWKRSTHSLYFDVVFTLSPLELPIYPLMWILDYLEEFTHRQEVKKTRLIEGVNASRKRVASLRIRSEKSKK